MAGAAPAGLASPDRYEPLEALGGAVYRARDRETGEEVAVRAVQLDEGGAALAEARAEVAALRACASPNVVRFRGAAAAPGGRRLLLATDLMAASAADLLAPGAGLDEPAIAYILREALNALVYLHSENHLHRDVRAASLLLSAEGMVKLADLGAAARLGAAGERRARHTFVGTPLWMAPEVIEQSPDAGGGAPGSPGAAGYGEAADIWSLGITAAEMALGAPPRAGEPAMRLLFQVVRDPPPALEGAFSPALKDFVAACLVKDPATRPAAMDLLSHPFVAAAELPPGLVARVAAHVAARPRRPAPADAFCDATLAPAEAFDSGTVCTVTPPAIAPVPVAPAAPRLEIPDAAAPPPPAPSATASSHPLADAAPLKLLLQPALAAATAAGGATAAAAAAAAAEALAALEAAAPGATRAALAEVVALLAATASPSLGDLRRAAEAAFAGSSSSAPHAAGAAAPASDQLGPLGDFLIARWRADASRERAAACEAWPHAR
jgi:serine/threonine-protein kinase 24/25/MST4